MQVFCSMPCGRYSLTPFVVLLRVLVHAATGGVGLAAVHLLRSACLHGIVGTAGSPAKRALLRCVCMNIAVMGCCQCLKGYPCRNGGGALHAVSVAGACACGASALDLTGLT